MPPAHTSHPLVIDVMLAPTLLPPETPARRDTIRDTIYVAIDVVRATTTICMLFECGCRRVLLASSVGAARDSRAALGPDWLLAGEVEGARPPGFDFGNSPAEFATLDLTGRDVICATTNGTRALRACAGGRAVFAGSLRNAEMLARTLAAERLERPVDVVFVCAGRGGRPAYDDTICAGYLVRGLRRAVGDERIVLGENARMACDLLAHVEATVGIAAALYASDAGQAVERIGLGDDITLCAAANVAHVLPALTGMYLDTDLYVVEDAARRPHE